MKSASFTGPQGTISYLSGAETPRIPTSAQIHLLPPLGEAIPSGKGVSQTSASRPGIKPPPGTMKQYRTSSEKASIFREM